MSAARLEHINLTVPSPHRTAQLLAQLFRWSIRWQGEQADGRMAIHVGGPDSYLSLYGPRPDRDFEPAAYGRPLNHVGVLVGDIEAVEERVRAAGLETFGHGSYEPGRRFYFFDPDGIEFEVISYPAS